MEPHTAFTEASQEVPGLLFLCNPFREPLPRPRNLHHCLLNFKSLWLGGLAPPKPRKYSQKTTPCPALQPITGPPLPIRKYSKVPSQTFSAKVSDIKHGAAGAIDPATSNFPSSYAGPLTH